MDDRQASERKLAAEKALREVEQSIARAAASAAPASASASEPGAPSSPGAPLPPAQGSADKELPHAPIIAIHGVGNFEYGDVIAQIASNKVYSEHDDFRRQTIYADNYRYTLLEEDKPAANGRSAPRFLEVNWSEVRKPLSSALGLLRNFVMVVLALARIGVYGAEGSRALGKPLRTPVALYVFEGMLVWAALLPMLSTLLWRVDVSSRLGVGIGVGMAAFYIAWLMRNISLPLLGGGVGFGLLSIAGGWVSCTLVERVYEAEAAGSRFVWNIAHQPGRDMVTSVAGALHSGSIIIAGAVLLIVALEVLFFMRVDAGIRSTWTQRFARVGCLWLPVVLLVIIQPLTVSAVLVTLSTPQQNAWGAAFEQGMLFNPRVGQFAGSLVALALMISILLGALQYKLVNSRGRNGTMVICLGLGAVLLLGALWADANMTMNCRCCARPDWVALAGLALVVSGILTYQLYRDHRSWKLPNDTMQWHPSGDCARLWAVCLLWGFPLVLLTALSVLFWCTYRGFLYVPIALQDVGPCNLNAVGVHVDQAFLQATKYAAVLLPLATKPFAALLDALGDVFYFVVKQDSLQTREDTVPRVGRAVQNMTRTTNGQQHLILFAHSQGTVIAAALLSRLSSALKGSPGRVTLLTVGSPVTSLYDSFLDVEIGAAYAKLCEAEPERFKWINMCRPADYVGSSVDLPGVNNRALLTPGNHTEYWRDITVLQWLKDRSEGLPEEQGAQTSRLKPIVDW